MSNDIIKEVCSELNIEYTYISNGWITELKKNDKVRYILGNKFDLNGFITGTIMDDKYALYSALKRLNIPIIEHSIIYSEFNNKSFAINHNTKENILDIFNKYNKDVVIKPNNGSQGKGVYHVTDEYELLERTTELFKNNYSLSICPFYHIKNEYRVILLDNEIKLIYKKINPTVIGDGISTLKELLTVFNPYYFINKDIPNIVLAKDEKYTYDFHFNLSKGSIASIDITEALKEKVSNLAKNVTKRMNFRFVSVDIIETDNKELLVMEVNSGVTISKVTNFIPDGYNIAKNIYKEAILKLFDE